MSLTQTMDKIITYIEEQGVSETTVAQLRTEFPDYHFTYCMDDDINYSKAYLERKNFNVYLVDSRDHCSTLTFDPETASGVVLAEVIE